ncbi:unnamed protein product [Tuber melanosporum]|uniref:(Perigord truffle) hypothetical protein n=1 Tax=Tuber melanosporum (strain Mel28) TaxID=656061 RepID=D5G4E3_TUBMM|nr:uncharacterized protein GSTUM_00004071001 [Tuber melanosporum]CAZ79386.1 unnamed protein product [Tuber melanosporum]
MRDCLNKVIEAIKDSDLSPLPPNREMLIRSGWTKHIGTMLDGTVVIVRQIALEHSHVLIHCSDGWDRTSQLSSLAQICLDPYFRTIDGFMALVEKDWVSFGHRFRDRCGFLGSDKWFIEKKVSPVFHQFLDATYQILYQNPTRFEYNERFLRRLLYHLYSCQYGTFLHNNDKERHDARIQERSRSVWDYFLARREMWTNEKYDPAADGADREREIDGGRVLFPRTGAAIRWWEECWGREVGEMNGSAISLPAPSLPEEGDGGGTGGGGRGASPAPGWQGGSVGGSDKGIDVEMM